MPYSSEYSTASYTERDAGRRHSHPPTDGRPHDGRHHSERRHSEQHPPVRRQSEHHRERRHSEQNRHSRNSRNTVCDERRKSLVESIPDYLPSKSQMRGFLRHTPVKREESHFFQRSKRHEEKIQERRNARPARRSMPDIKPHPASLPAPNVHGGRGRFTSLPVTEREDRDQFEHIEERRASTPHHRDAGGLHGILCEPRKEVEAPRTIGPAPGRLATDEPPLVPKWHYKRLMRRIRARLWAEGKNIKDYVDVEDIQLLYFIDVEATQNREYNRERIERMRNGEEPHVFTRHHRAFATPLKEASVYASTEVVIDGCKNYVPIAVFTCVEELYRTGLHQQGLFRTRGEPNHQMQLIQSFNTPPLFGWGYEIEREHTFFITGLLSSWIKNLAEPLIHAVLFEALWQWCVKPSVQRHEQRMSREDSEEEEARTIYYQTGVKQVRPTRRQIAARHRKYDVEDEKTETPQIANAQDIFRLMPTHYMSALVYLCAFFTQVPLFPENGLSFDDIAKRFGQHMLGGTHTASRAAMIWLLKRWPRIMDGLFDPESIHPESEDIVGEPEPDSPDGTVAYPSNGIRDDFVPHHFDSGYTPKSPAAFYKGKKKYYDDDSIAPDTPLYKIGPSTWSPSNSEETLASADGGEKDEMPEWAIAAEDNEQEDNEEAESAKVCLAESPKQADESDVAAMSEKLEDTHLELPQVFTTPSLSTIESASQYSSHSGSASSLAGSDTTKVDASSDALNERLQKLEQTLCANQSMAEDMERVRVRLEAAEREKEEAQKAVQDMRRVLAAVAAATGKE